MRPRALSGLLVVVGVGLAAGFAVAELQRPGPPRVRPHGPPIAVSKALSTFDPHFGDPITATVDVTLDPSRVDSGSVRITSDFTPYRVAGRTRKTTRTGGVSTVHLTYRLRCADSTCLPSGAYRTVRLSPLHVAYRSAVGPGAIARPWPAVRVHTRLAAGDLQHPFLRVGPPVAAPPRYRLPPGLTGYALLVLSGLLALGGVVLVVGAALGGRRLRRTTVVPPLDQTLRELAAASANGDPGRRRRALDRLSRELEFLEERLSVESRVLAWSPKDPEPAAIADLSTRVRTAVRR